MYRFLFKKKGFLSFFLFYILCTCVIFFISDDSFHHLDHKKFYVQDSIDTSPAATALRGNVPSTNTAENLATARPKPLLHKGQYRGKVFFALVKNNTKERASRKDSNETVLKMSEKGWTPPPNAGEGGKAVIMQESELSPEQKRRKYQGRRNHHFNQFLSDHISLHRTVPKLKDLECLQIQYRSDLPAATVVIIFHNEAFSTLLRTVHSVLDRSPPHLLQQVILVDDFSDMEHLKQPLDDYLQQPELRKVTVLRLPSRDGLVKARLVGLSHAKTSAVVFLDSHCECFEGWLEPLLDRIARDPSTVVLPVIDVIDSTTFAININHAQDISVGTFDWNLFFNWMPIQPSERRRRKSDIEPVRSPTMAGGLFAIDRDFFYKLGTYDPGMKIWGGENLELSFKTWMCGGTMEIVPCSHVGHIFRTMSPHGSGPFQNYLNVNIARLALVWLEDYRVYHYTHRGFAEENGLRLAGNISERLELKRRLKCHSFAWFMKYVMPEVYLPPDFLAHGKIENKMTGLCIALEDNNLIVLQPCPNEEHNIRTELLWYMNPGQSTVFQSSLSIQTERTCLDYVYGKGSVKGIRCHWTGGNQLWEYSERLKQLYHVISKKCAQVNPLASDTAAGDKGRGTVTMATCDPNNPLQQWTWDTTPLPGPSWRKDEAAGKPVL